MRIILAYLAVIAIWSTTPLAIKWSGELDWFFGIAARMGFSAIFILPLVFWFTSRKFSFSWSAIKVYAAASLSLLGGMTPVYWAAQTMPSGWVALIWGMIPIATGVLIYFLLDQQRLTLNKWIGILLSFCGLVVLVAPNLDAQQASLQITGLIVILVGVVFHSLSTVLVKKTNHDLPPLHVVAGALWITSFVLLMINPSAYLDWPALDLKTSLTIGYLVVIGSVLGFALYYYVLKHMDALRLGMIPMITPVFALILGYLVNDEELNMTIWLGAGLVVLGLIFFELNHFSRYHKQRQLLKNLDIDS